ncbi:ATP-binding protein [uncultured Brevibacillus sp.]|uniref:ATP-binding protein n=1 Tax=uncultured Brevibacillus sp. TaxID=169970 RepID=UPI002597BD68|nr:ATP-binding protein [uncultured Brevibacillus sp.]
MLRRTFIIIFISLLSFSLLPLSVFWDIDEPMNDLAVRHGVMDLTAWDYEHDKRIKLDGEWEFYWNQLLTPEDFKQRDKPSPTTFMTVPSQWNGKIIDSKPLPAYGYATYRMVLKNVPYSGIFALKKTNIRFSSAVYANGHKLFEDGKPTSDVTTYRAGNVPKFGSFSSEKGDIEIIVQVANYDYINSGIPLSIYFGGQADMNEIQQRNMGYELGTFVILGTLATIYFICFITASLYGKKDDSLLFFAIVCFLYAIYSGLISERPLLLFFHHVSFEAMYKWKDIVSTICFIVLAIFFYQLQKSIISLKFTQIVSAILGAYLLLIVFLPIHVYMEFQAYIMGLYELMLFWLLMRTAILYIKKTTNNSFKSFLMFMAILTINLYSLDLILFAFSIKDNIWLGQLYIVAFNIIMVFLIVLRFFEAYHTIDEMKDQLLQLDKIKDDFLSNTSHELKTPLNAIVSITDTLIKGVEGPVTEKQAYNLAIVLENGRRLTHLVNELLDYSKMKHGDISLFKSQIDLKAAVDSVIGIHMFLLGGKPITLVNKIAEDAPQVYVDGNRLIQILHNLLDNAIKFTDKGIVEISAVAVRDLIEVRVADTGIGIEKAMQERIFNAFEQEDASVTKNYGGTGLGLSITKKLVELHGGEIRVESSPGRGSVFIFTIPAAKKEDRAIRRITEQRLHRLPPKTHGAYPISIKGVRDETILVVDDDFANLQAMINLLKLEGYSIVVVNRGRLALEELSKKTDFFLVILDIMMPDMSGYEVLRLIRERYSTSELPVLMLTAKNRVSDMIVTMENGANEFVGKPFEAEELMARVRNLTRLKASVKMAKDAEIAFLRSQIKPHFLFNALNSIAALCMDEPQKAEELTLQLSEYLRGSFDFKQLDSLTTIENELSLVNAYIMIEKARFGSRLQVEYDIEANLEFQLPPLILQPLVENAIRHGLMSNFRGGTVNVSIKQLADNAIRFTVEDDGCGMSDKKIEEIMATDVRKKGVGLWNISQRIKLLYGSSVRIESKEGTGTKVSFDIPALPKVEMEG